MATHSILPGDSPWTEEPGGRQSIGSQSQTPPNGLHTCLASQGQYPVLSHPESPRGVPLVGCSGSRPDDWQHSLSQNGRHILCLLKWQVPCFCHQGSPNVCFWGTCVGVGRGEGAHRAAPLRPPLPAACLPPSTPSRGWGQRSPCGMMLGPCWLPGALGTLRSSHAPGP